MCGIVGKVYRDLQRPVDPELIGFMQRCLLHRGPDEAGAHLRAPVGFGFQRLAIIDLNSGQQPMHNEDGSLVIVFNGEIYNFLDLREELISAGHDFKTRSDTETILHGYEQWGTDVVSRLRGMFAFAIYDYNRHALFVARDRVGKKPLYYAHVRRGAADEAVLFASELKSLLADPVIERRVDYTAVAHYLALQYVPHPWSILNAVSKLPPAHWMLWKDGNLQVDRYWQLEYEPKLDVTEEQAVEQTLEQLDDAVRVRLMSEVPLGCFLSGGVDSSAVVAMMRRHISGDLKTFSIGFREEEFNELPYARQVAQRFETQHQELIVEPDAIESLGKLAWFFDEPFGDMSAIPTYYVSRMTRQYVTVALNGDGGDESFAGYHRYCPNARLQKYRNLPSVVRGGARAFLAGLSFLAPDNEALQRSMFVTELAEDPDESVYAQTLMIFREYQRRQIMGTQHVSVLNEADADSAGLVLAAIMSRNARTHIDRKMYADISTYLPGDLLVKVDRMTMANSLEGRSPFLDHKLMEFAARIPAHIKFKGGEQKYLLKRTLLKFFPPEFLQRKKMGFAVPMASWLRNELRDVAADHLFGEKAKKRGTINTSYAQRLFQDHLKGRRDHSHRLWILLMLEAWSRTYLDGPGVANRIPELL